MVVEKRPRGRPRKNLKAPVNIREIKVPVVTIAMDSIKKVDNLILEGNLAENWRKFKQNFQIYLTAAGHNAKKDDIKIAIFLNAIGPEAIEVYNTFNLSDEEAKVYANVLNAFEIFCKPKKSSIIYARFMFTSRLQKPGEPFDSFLIEIKKLVKDCAYADEDSMLRDRIVFGVEDKRTQHKLLQNEDLDYNKAVETCRSLEVTQKQARTMASATAPSTSHIHSMTKDKYNSFSNKNNYKNSHNSNPSENNFRKPSAFSSISSK
jgi:hypothetical protein